MSGTHIRVLRVCEAVSGTHVHALRLCYAMSGTHMQYPATRPTLSLSLPWYFPLSAYTLAMRCVTHRALRSLSGHPLRYDPAIPLRVFKNTPLSPYPCI
eukprot:1699131-Rhodomonas_salina.2